MSVKAVSATGMAGLAIGLVLQGIVATSPAYAQDTGDVTLTTEQKAPVCLTGAWRDVPQVERSQRGQPLQVVVAETDAPGLEKRGFVRTECASVDLAASDKRGAWRDQVCEMAAFGNEAVQNQFEKALSARPAVLCGSAELVAGQWRGQGADTTRD